MTLKRVLRLSNRRVRIAVGLFLAGLFCIQCTRTDAFKESNFVTVIRGKSVGKTAPGIVRHLEKLAKTDHIALLRRCMAHCQTNYRDYTCTLVKQERLRGQLSNVQEVAVKFRRKPFSVAMAWKKNAGRGDRVLYIEGRHGGKMLVRPTNRLLRALAGTVQRDPEGKDARKSSLRTVNKFGFHRGMASLLAFYELARKNAVLKQEFAGHAQVEGRDTLVLVRYLPDTSKYPAFKTLAYLDTEYLVPILVEGFDSSGRLICRYLYRDVKFNVDLTEEDFTPQANGMDAPK